MLGTLNFTGLGHWACLPSIFLTAQPWKGSKIFQSVSRFLFEIVAVGILNKTQQ